MSKTYEEIEAENQRLEVTLERKQLRLKKWVALHTECLTALNDTRFELEKTQAKLARVKAKTCRDCTKLFEKMAEKQLASRSCETCDHNAECLHIVTHKWHDGTGKYRTSRYQINHCSLWEAKK